MCWEEHLSSLSQQRLQTPLSDMTSKDTSQVRSITDQLGIIDICRKLHPTAGERTLFLNSWGKSTRLDHSVGHVTIPNKARRTQDSTKQKTSRTKQNRHNGIKQVSNRNIARKILKNLKVK